MIEILVVFFFAVGVSLGRGSDQCRFPGSWTGNWFQNGVPGPITIENDNISLKGRCVESSGDKFLIEDRQEGCFRCVVIHEKHPNVLQYKETFCDERSNLDLMCEQITGDAHLFSMFRLEAYPIQCPIRGPFTFTYSRGYRECKYPVSTVDQCTDDTRLLFRFQACPDVQGTESTVEELQCLASWKEGSLRYLVGKLQHKTATTNEDKFRCFVYERNKEVDPPMIQLAQSGDSTCNGLASATEGSRNLKLLKAMHVSPKCHFPSWILKVAHQWHTLDHQQTYLFGFHHNHTLHIMDSGSPHPIPMPPSSAVLPLLTSSKSGAAAGEGIGVLTAPADDEAGDRLHGMKVVCVEEVPGSYTPDSVTVIAHMTKECKNGYVCMTFHKRSPNVIEVQTGHLSPTTDDVCQPVHFDKGTAEHTTLISSSPQTRQCPYLGKNLQPGTTKRPVVSAVPAASSIVRDRRSSTTSRGVMRPEVGDRQGGDEGRSKCRGFSLLRVGCDPKNTFEFEANCPSDSRIETYECYANWQESGRNYMVASVKGTKQVYCLSYTENERVFHFSSMQDSCHRHVEPGIGGSVAFNVTLYAQCSPLVGEVSNLNAASSSNVPFTSSVFLVILILVNLR